MQNTKVSIRLGTFYNDIYISVCLHMSYILSDFEQFKVDGGLYISALLLLLTSWCMYPYISKYLDKQ